MKVLHLSESRQWSGGAAQLEQLVAALAARGCEQLVACPPDGELSRRLHARGQATVSFLPREDYDLAAAWRLSRLIRRQRPDVVHAHHSRAHAVGALAKLLSGLWPVFVVSRRVSFPVGQNLFSRLKYGTRLVDGYLAVAESVRRVLAAGGVPRERIATIYSGVDLSRFSPRPPDGALKREIGANGHPVIGLIANRGRWKGQDVFLRAARALRDKGVPSLFLLAGVGTDSPEMRADVRRAGLDEGSVRLLGFRADVPGLLSCLSISVNASVAGEGLSGALRESLAMGIPVVASAVAGNPELVKPGQTGELFPPGDWRALADRLAALLDDPARARRLAENGRSWVGQNLSFDKTAAATLAFYESRLRR